MKTRNLALVAAVSAALSVPATTATAGEMEWFGAVYAKFLDGSNRYENALYNTAEGDPTESGGDQGQGVEFELMFRNVVSKQVEVGGRLKARFNQNFWTNFGGFGKGDEDNPRSAQYMKMRGVYAIITPGYEWIDSATIGSNDFGMFDPMTQGKYRYIDRDNASGLLFQGSALQNTLRWDLARVSLPRLFAGPAFDTRGEDDALKLEHNDAAYVGQMRLSPSTDWNATAIGLYVRDKEVAPDELLDDGNNEDGRDGSDVVTRYDNLVLGLKAEYSGFDAFDLSGAYYYSDYNVDPNAGAVSPWVDGEGARFSPLLNADADDEAWFINLDIADFLIPDLTFAVQAFHIGADYMSVQAARREQDVLLSQGWMTTWAWQQPDYNFGNRENGNSTNGAGIGYGGWNGEAQAVAGHLMADNQFTDFDEPWAYNVNGYEGFTIVPQYTWGDWEFSGEYSYYDYDSNWQACGGRIDNDGTTPDVGYRTSCDKYPMNENVNSWGLGGWNRNPYSPYQDRETEMWGFTANYLLDVLNGFDLEFRYRFIEDDDDRVKTEEGLADAYGDGYAGASIDRSSWVFDFDQQFRDCTGCDDRKAEYSQLGFSVGYQVHPDLYLTVLYDYWETDLVDGTVDVAKPVASIGGGFEFSNNFGFLEYLTGEHTKNRLGIQANYFLSGVEFGGSVDWFWGEYKPEFYTNNNGVRSRLIPAGDFVATPLGDIATDDVDLEQYRLKAFMKVSF